MLTMVHQMSTLLSEDSIHQDIYDDDLSYLHELEQLDLLDKLCARNNASDNNWFDGMHDLRATEVVTYLIGLEVSCNEITS